MAFSCALFLPKIFVKVFDRVLNTLLMNHFCVFRFGDGTRQSVSLLSNGAVFNAGNGGQLVLQYIFLFTTLYGYRANQKLWSAYM